MRILSLALAAALALSPAACGEGGRAPSTGEGPPGAPVAVDSAPTLSVGVLEGDPARQFGGVVDPFLLPDGSLAVPDRGSAEIRVFGPDGELLRRLGGPGEGPGEFDNLRSAWPRGDTVEAWDSDARRITRFLPDGEVDVVPVRAAGRPLDAGIGPLGEGWALVSVDFGGGRDRMGAERISREGEHLGTVVELPGMARHRTPGMAGPHPVTPTALFAARAGRLYAAETLTPAVRVYDAASDSVGAIPLFLPDPGDPGEVFRAVVDSAVAREEGRAAARPEETRRGLSAFPEPEAISRFWDLLVDPEGFVWVRSFDPFEHALALGGSPAGRGGPGGEWIVVDRDGTEVARIRIPAGLEPARITADALVGIHRDELGVESVRVHALYRRGAGQEPPVAEPASGQESPLGQLDWMAGCWERASGDLVVEERWLSPRGGLTLGVSRTLRGGRAVGWEFLRISEGEDGIVLVAHPSEQAVTEFRAVAVADTLAAFENPEHDFPQRVLYRPGGDSLFARIEGEAGGETRGVDFRMGRVACE